MARIFLPALLLFWAGLLFGVSFLATPAKFAAPILSMAAAIDVGRQTFGWLSRFEIGLAVILLGLVWKGTTQALVRLGAGAVCAIVATQALWLLPVLDERAEVVVNGRTPPPSNLHTVYIATDVAELALLAALGLATLYSLSRSRAQVRSL